LSEITRTVQLITVQQRFKRLRCSFGSEAEMCGQVKVTRLNNAKFKAVQIGQPETSAEIVLKIFRILPDDDWMMEDERMLQIN